MALTKKQRAVVYSKYGGRCAYCGELLQDRWHSDHVEPIVRDLKDKSKCERPENERLDNYFPSCPSCNIIKNSMSVETFRKNISGMLNSLNSYSTQYKFAKKYGLVLETNTPVLFYFETYRYAE